MLQYLIPEQHLCSWSHIVLNHPIWCWGAEKGCFASCIMNPHYHSQKAHGKLITIRKQIKHKNLNIYTCSYMHIRIWGKIPSTQTGNSVSTTSRAKAHRCFRQDLQLFSYWTKFQNTCANFSNGNLMCAAQQSEKGEFTLGLWPGQVYPYFATAKAKILHRTGWETSSTGPPCLHQPFSATKEKRKGPRCYVFQRGKQSTKAWQFITTNPANSHHRVLTWNSCCTNGISCRAINETLC